MKLLRTFSLYTFIGFLNAGISFLIMPVLTHYLTPEDYGIISLVNTYVSILIPIVGLSTASLVSVEYYNKRLSENEFKSLFTVVRILPVLVSFFLFFVLFLGSSYLPLVLELPKTAYWMLVPLTLCALYNESFVSFLVISKRIFLFSVASLSKIFIEIPLTLILIIYAGMQWDGRIYAWLITMSIFALLSFFFYKRWNLISTHVDKAHFVQAVTFGAPLIMHEIGKFVINQSDRIFLAKMVSVEEMGIYSVGYQVGMVVLIVNTAFVNFFSPFLLERLNKGTIKDKIEIVRVSYLYIIGIFLLLAVLTLLTPSLFTFLISERFARGAQYVFWVGLSYFFWGVYLIFAGYIYFLKKNKILAYLSLINVILNLLLNYFFIQWFGALGAAYATCLSFFIVSFVVGFLVQRLYPMPWFEWKKIASFQ